MYSLVDHTGTRTHDRPQTPTDHPNALTWGVWAHNLTVVCIYSAPTWVAHFGIRTRNYRKIASDHGHLGFVTT